MTNGQALEQLERYLSEHEPSDLSWSASPDCAFWFDNAAANDQFHVFASRGDGSLVAVWKKSGPELDGCPVVVLGGEGELAVLGADVASALAVIAKVGTNDFMVFINVTDDEARAVHEASDADEAKVLAPDQAFATWVSKTLGAEMPHNLSKALRANMKAHPGLIKLARGLVKPRR